MPAKRNTASTVPLKRLPTRVCSRRYVEVGSIRKMLEAAARNSPAFFLKLADSLREAKPDQAAAD